MTIIDVRDVQSYEYVTDGGQKVNITFAEMSTHSHKFHNGYNMSVTVDVDGVNRLSSDTHFSTIAEFGLGEQLVMAVLLCLNEHLTYWMKWQELQSLMAESALPPRLEVPEAIVPVYQSNLAVRHIEELTDEQAFWWCTDKEWDGCTTDGPDGVGVQEHLLTAIEPVWFKWKTDNEIALAVLDAERQAQGMRGLTNLGFHD